MGFAIRNFFVPEDIALHSTDQDCVVAVEAKAGDMVIPPRPAVPNAAWALPPRGSEEDVAAALDAFEAAVRHLAGSRS